MTYAVKTDRGVSFYYYSGGRLLKRVKSSRGLSGEFQLIQGVRPSFSMNLTPKGETYIFCRDLKGSVILIRENKKGVSRRVLLENKEKGFKGSILFDAEISENEIELLYNTPEGRNGANSLYLQRLSEKSPPMVVDTAFLLGGEAFRVYGGKSGRRIVFYLKRKGSSRLGYREISGGNIGEFNTVFSGNCIFGAYSVFAEDGACYFAAVSASFLSSRLLFRAKNGSFSEVKTIAEMPSVAHPLVFAYKNKPYIFFKSGLKTYIYSENEGLKPFEGKICPNLSRGIFIDRSERRSIEAREMLVCSEKPWDIQIYPEIDESFYSFREKSQKKPKPREYSFDDFFLKKGSESL